MGGPLFLVLVLGGAGAAELTRCADSKADAAALAAVSLEVNRLAEANGFGWEGPRGRGFAAGVPVPEPTPLPLAEIVRRIEALRTRPCFALSVESSRWERPASIDALVEWWRAGGESWLASYVSGERQVVIPPDVRPSLVLDGNEKHPLAPILCRGGDRECGAETRGWARRAEAALRLHAVDEGLARRARGDEDPDPFAACPRTDYRAWRTCLEGKREAWPALPAGRFRAPEGWIAIRGRRGHYSFCDEVRLYDLSSGSAWIAQSCSGLVLTDGGGVDGAATDAGRGIRARAGTVPRDAIREAAWMALLAPHVAPRIQPHARFVPVPDGMEIRWPRGLGYGVGLGFSGWFSSAQTQLRWTWLRMGRVQHGGTLTWPDSSDAAESHAVDLLRIAEDGFREGCPPSSPPRELFALTSGAPVSAIDASRESVSKAQDALVDALRALRPCE